MNRMIALIRWETTLQIRNGFLAATIFVTGFWMVILAQSTLDLRGLLPAMLIGNLLLGTFYFVAGMVLLELTERTIYAQAVTPLRLEHYLAAKIATLTALALAESVIIAVMARGWPFAPLPLIIGIVLASAIYCLCGFIAVVRYPSINAFLIPSGGYAAVLWIPLLTNSSGWSPWLTLWMPIGGPLTLVNAAFRPVDLWQIVAATFFSIGWIAVLLFWSCKAHQRWVLGYARED
ncbi:MAG: hypothetical protein SH847_21625 [Roseiflexaceae bacterium]|nr:hypothetical protein [Roseiflexaceae bacterium]